MDFRFTDDQLTLAESVRDYLAGTHGPEVLRRLDTEGNRDPAIWQGLVEMGLTGLLVPEAQGGLGMGLVEAALIAAECGRACLAEPLVDTAFVGVPWLVGRGEAEGLEAVVAGERRIALSHAINPWVADGEGAPVQSVDPLRNLALRDGEATDDADLLNLGALMSAAQLVGLVDAMLTQAVEYAKIRTQFGQPVGAFQGLKHQLASCSVAIEFAKPVVWRAASALQDGAASAAVHVSHAKLAATDAAMLTAETAIQVHGAMGYTYEVDLHFWMKRAWALAGAWGDRAFHYARIDDAVLGGALAIGPEHTFA
ncbi:acyl-CoA dehydrogenase family protein [Novosphingobium taihuense]|uniref:Alkylation response protein AidB-like acyl-CoA dehydrogenase n=1 Tax=Novosphingobium taihuense TaxID=260085 RepID=A0A7W7ABR1_9SPHN|nr:acyl-CoA dehydrogenase [Novosphingobium taihuense]MBB4613926.1 alkylation response protein AidB-like acyl-CoA dehydrogenase [Novosphingobium taihuense]TWH86777.1 acyl-CoA dehydrogenase-like protein [Novosphingobium taihuense]